MEVMHVAPKLDPKLERLCKDFKRHYESYDASLVSDSFLNTPDNPPFVLFGTSGAGKSTTVARLLDKSDAETFKSRLEEDIANNRETTFVEDVYIGHSDNASCTVEPKPYVMYDEEGKPFVVCDMPGFAESDDDKKIIIDILQKCFLTFLRTPRLLIVVEVEAIYENHQTKLKEHYHNALYALMGTKYEEALDHLYFLVTRNNDNISHADIQDHLNALALKRLRSDKNEDARHFTQFLCGIADASVMVDLNIDTNTTLLSKIASMVTEREERQKLGRFAPNWHIERLQSGENALNHRCYVKIQTSITEQTKLEKQSKHLQEEWSSKESSLRTEMENLRKEKMDAVEAARKVLAAKKSIQLKVDKYAEKRAALVKQLIEKKEILDVHAKQKKIFGQNFTDIDSISVHCILSEQAEIESKPKPTMLRRGSAPVPTTMVHSIAVSWDLRLYASDIFILAAENRNSISKFVDASGRVKADKLENIVRANFDSDSAVLFTSSGHNLCQADFRKENGALQLRIANRPKPFQVYILASRSLKSTALYGQLEKHFNDDVLRDQEAIGKLDEAIMAWDKAHDADLRKLRELEAILKDSNYQLAALQTTTVQLQHKHHSVLEEMSDKIATLRTNIEARETDSLISLIEWVVKTFAHNKIDSNCETPLKSYKSGFAKLHSTVQDVEEIVKSFSDSSKKEVLYIQGLKP